MHLRSDLSLRLLGGINAHGMLCLVCDTPGVGIKTVRIQMHCEESAQHTEGCCLAPMHAVVWWRWWLVHCVGCCECAAAFIALLNQSRTVD